MAKKISVPTPRISKEERALLEHVFHQTLRTVSDITVLTRRDNLKQFVHEVAFSHELSAGHPYSGNTAKDILTLLQNKAVVFGQLNHDELDNPCGDYNIPSMGSVRTVADLSSILSNTYGLSEVKASSIASTAWSAVTVAIIDNPGAVHDPVTGLTFPPVARSVDYRSRPKAPGGRRMTFAEYLADEVVGWGGYTRQHAMASFWLMELDKPAYQAGLYLAEKEADEAGAPPKSSERSAIIDAFFLRHGVLTTQHLSTPPQGLAWQAKLLKFVRKLETKLHRGNRSVDELTDR